MKIIPLSSVVLMVLSLGGMVSGAEPVTSCSGGLCQSWLTRDADGIIVVQDIPSGEKPIPAGPDARTQKDFSIRKIKWMQRHMQADLAKTPLPKGADQERVMFFLQEVIKASCQSFEAKPWSELMREADELQKTPASQHYMFIWGKILCLEGTYRHEEIPDAIMVLDPGAKLWGAVPALWSYDMLRACPDTTNLKSRIQLEWIRLAELMGCFKKGVFTADEMDIFARALTVGETVRANLEYEPYIKQYTELTKRDAWAHQIWCGSVEVERAWKARGGGFASSVAPEGWKGWGTHMKNAYTHFSKAYALRPDRPEAAASMIKVLCGYSQEGDSARLWFDRAVAAQMDYMPAYANYELFALNSVWGGRLDAYKAFALECLNTNRFDTAVPLYYLVCIRRLSLQARIPDWKIPFRNKEEQQRLDRFLTGFEASPVFATTPELVAAVSALVKTWMGRYAEAKRAFDAIPDKTIYTCPLPYTMLKVIYTGLTPEQVAAELELFTGPDSAAMMTARAHVDRGEWKAAASAFRAILKRHMESPGAFEYLIRRIIVCEHPEINWAVSPMRSEGFSPYIFALEIKDMELLRWLQECKMPIDHVDSFGRTPLSYAIFHSGPAVCKIFLDMGAKPDFLLEGNNAVNAAFCEKDPVYLDMLLDAGLDPNTCLPRSKSNLLIHQAVYYGQIEHAKVLIKHKVDINREHPLRKDVTALSLAMTHRRVEMLKPLLDAGACMRGVSAKIMFDYFCRNNERDMMSIILDADMPPYLDEATHNVLRDAVQASKNPDLEIALKRAEIRWAKKASPAQQAPSDSTGTTGTTGLSVADVL